MRKRICMNSVSSVYLAVGTLVNECAIIMIPESNNHDNMRWFNLEQSARKIGLALVHNKVLEIGPCPDSDVVGSGWSFSRSLSDISVRTAMGTNLLFMVLGSWLTLVGCLLDAAWPERAGRFECSCRSCLLPRGEHVLMHDLRLVTDMVFAGLAVPQRVMHGYESANEPNPAASPSSLTEIVVLLTPIISIKTLLQVP